MRLSWQGKENKTNKHVTIGGFSRVQIRIAISSLIIASAKLPKAASVSQPISVGKSQFLSRIV